MSYDHEDSRIQALSSLDEKHAVAMALIYVGDCIRLHASMFSEEIQESLLKISDALVILDGRE